MESSSMLYVTAIASPVLGVAGQHVVRLEVFVEDAMSLLISSAPTWALKTAPSPPPKLQGRSVLRHRQLLHLVGTSAALLRHLQGFSSHRKVFSVLRLA